MKLDLDTGFLVCLYLSLTAVLCSVSCLIGCFVFNQMPLKGNGGRKNGE